MRAIIAAALLLGGCSAGAQPMCQYDFYIYEPLNSDAQIYAVIGSGRNAAIEVNACEARLVNDPNALASQLRTLRREDEINIVTVEGRGSRTYLGSCSARDDDHDPENPRDENAASIVVVSQASAAQTRRLINQIDAAPSQMRESVIDTLGLRGCMGQTAARR